MLKSNQVSKCFGTTIAVNNFSIQIDKGEIFGLVGPDGAGKTTFMRMVCDLMKSDSGNITIMDLPVDKFPREKIGYMPQRFSLYRDLTISENIDFFASLYGLDKKITRERAGEILEVTGLKPFTKRLADNLSGGMRQKLALTCALITRPQFLILDEPTYGVDPESRKEFWQILYRLNETGMTILISTPYMDEAELCHRVGLINSGELVACDSPAGLKHLFINRVLEVKANMWNPYFFDDCPGVIDSSYYFSRYHLLVDNTENRQLDLENYLVAHGIRDAEIKMISPGMEDVFVFLAEPRLKTPAGD